MDFLEKQLERSTQFEGRVFNVHVDTVRLKDDSITTRELVEHGGAVAVIACDTKGNLLMVEQFRYGSQKVMLELPAGLLEPGETTETCGLRELEEETGYQAQTISAFGAMYSTPAYDSEKIYFYVAEDLVETEQQLDPGEFLNVKRVPLKKAVELCKDGSIQDSKTVVGVLRYAAMYPEKLQKE